MTSNILEMHAITKTFPGVKALGGRQPQRRARRDPRDLRRERRRQVHPHEGAVRRVPARQLRRRDRFDGEPVRVRLDQRQRAPGIVIIHQELALIPYLSVAENIFLGNERRGAGGLIDWNRANHEAAELLAQVGLDENPTTPVGQLGVGKQQLIEIAKALSKSVRLLILDEPTAALNDNDSEHLLGLLRRLKDQGITSIIISHKLNEIAEIADRTTIIRDGRTIETIDMTAARHPGPDHPRHGRPRPRALLPRSRRRTSARRCFRVEDWTVNHPTQPGRVVVEDANFHVPRARSSASPG